MRTLAIGDVHGCHLALTGLLEMLDVQAGDRLVFLGDLVDRGPASRRVMDVVIELQSKCDVVLIMGNHEQMMRDAISGMGRMQSWLEAGGHATMKSYGGDVKNIPPAHIRLLLSGRPYYETPEHIFVHASLEYGISLINQSTDFLRWKRIGGSERPHISGKRVICGHTPQPDGLPAAFGGWVCIDTYAHRGLWLTGLDVDRDHVYQASEQGERRDFPLASKN